MLLVAVNGAYGDRMVTMARVLGIDVASIAFHERSPVDVSRVLDAVRADAAITHVAVVHHETTAGVLNDVDALGRGLRALSAERAAVAGSKAGSGGSGSGRLTFIVDSMSAFGAYPLNVASSGVDFLVSSSNKCIEGVPGFSFVIAAADALAACKGNARSLSLDLHAQWAGLAANAQFRFTPPTHALLAFRQALAEHEAEGGSAGRLSRYASNHAALVEGMAQLGFAPYVDPQHAGCIITTFLVPDDPRFDFKAAYDALAARGFVIYPGKTTVAESFRLGSIGRLYPADVRAVVAALRDVLTEQGVALPVRQKK